MGQTTNSNFKERICDTQCEESYRILWIGMFASEKHFNEMQSKGFRQAAAQLTQLNYINGIEYVLEAPIETLNGYVLPAYPEYSDWKIVESIWSHAEGSNDISVGFLNFKYINHISRTLSLEKAAMKWGMKNKDANNVKILVYSMHSPYLSAARVLKKIVPNAKVYLIVPDLPQYMDATMTRFKKIMKRVDWKRIKKLMMFVDGYFLYTNQMANYLNLTHDQWIRIEGSVNYKLINEQNLLENKYSKKVCVYAGALEGKYRLDIFIQSFINADIDDSELHIYGNGNLSKEIEKLSKANKNIKYFGFCENREIIIAELKATLLVNPRPTSEDYTKFSCPSKTLEYMVSGTPLLTTRLAGIPDEYFEYIFCINDESLEGMTRILKEVLGKSREELHKKGMNAKHFMLTKKSNIVQAKKMLDFMRVDF